MNPGLSPEAEIAEKKEAVEAIIDFVKKIVSINS